MAVIDLNRYFDELTEAARMGDEDRITAIRKLLSDGMQENQNALIWLQQEYNNTRYSLEQTRLHGVMFWSLPQTNGVYDLYKVEYERSFTKASVEPPLMPPEPPTDD